MARPSDNYGTFGSVADNVSQDGSGASSMGVHANADDFGGQVGQAVQGAGQSVEKVSQDVSDIMLKQAQMANETAMTNADINTAIQAGKIRADYMSKTGMAAYNSFPKFQTDMQGLIEQGKQGLSPMAARGYEMLARRTIASHIIDGSGYAASQLKTAQRDSASNLMDISVGASGDPQVANNPQRFAEHLGNIKYGAAMQLGNELDEDSGLQQHPETGAVSFSDTPQGQQSKQQYDSTVSYNTGLAWQNRINALAKENPVNASQVFADNKSNIPADAAVRIEAGLQPQVQNYHATNVVGNTLNEANIAHQDVLLNPSSSGSNAFNLGNVKTASGAANGTADFVKPATPVDGAIVAANNLRSNYQGLTLAEIGNKWAPPSENKTNDWVKNVSATSGLSPDSVPNLNDPSQLSSLLKGIATAEKSPTDRANFSDDVISQAAQSSISGEKPNVSNKPYATNPDGSPLSRADYYASHKDTIIAAGDRYAEQTMPGDLEFKNIVRQRLNNQMDTAINSQAAQYKQDNAFIQKGISGALTNGKPPSTYEELQQIQGMGDVLNRSAVHSPQYYQGIDTQINKISAQNNTTNSPNAYGTIMRVLADPAKHVDTIESESKLSSLLGRSNDTGINAKDYNDSLKSIDVDKTWKDFLYQHMQDISSANGNVDGQGPQRAVAFYNYANQVKEANEKKDPDFLNNIDKYFEKQGPEQYQPSRMTQLANWAKSIVNGKDKEVPTLTDKAQFDALPSGSLYMRNGQQFRKP